MKFYNTNARYGDAGPHESDSKEALADKMMELINGLAYEEFDDIVVLMGEDEYNDWMDGRSNDQVISEIAQRMRSEFVAGLEIVNL